LCDSWKILLLLIRIKNSDSIHTIDGWKQNGEVIFILAYAPVLDIEWEYKPIGVSKENKRD
jgi:hypothetical protein